MRGITCEFDTHFAEQGIADFFIVNGLGSGDGTSATGGAALVLFENRDVANDRQFGRDAIQRNSARPGERLRVRIRIQEREHGMNSVRIQERCRRAKPTSRVHAESTVAN